MRTKLNFLCLPFFNIALSFIDSYRPRVGLGGHYALVETDLYLPRGQVMVQFDRIIIFDSDAISLPRINPSHLTFECKLK